MKPIRNKFVLLAIVIAGLTTAYAQDPLPSWNDGPAKKAITEFVAKVRKEGSPDFVPPAERISTFDNDGTLWAEQPIYFQFAFAIDRIKALAPQHPEWKTKEPFASFLGDDMKAALAGGEKGLLEMMAATHTGMTVDEFSKILTLPFPRIRASPRLPKGSATILVRPFSSASSIASICSATLDRVASSKSRSAKQALTKFRGRTVSNVEINCSKRGIIEIFGFGTSFRSPC